MSGRQSPQDDSDPDLPAGMYVNPDTLPMPDPQQVVIDPNRSYTPVGFDGAGGQSKAKASIAKMGKLFKKGTDKLKIKKKKDDEAPMARATTGASQLGDVMGKVSASSAGSSGTRSTDSRPAEIPKSTAPGPVEQGILRKPKPIQMPSIQQSTQASYAHRDTLATEPVDENMLDTVRSGLRTFFKGPPAPSPPCSPHADMDRAPLKAPPPKSPCRMSIVLLVIFSLIISIGISLLIFGGDDSTIAEHCQVLGPCFLGLGIFGLIGNIFFILFWNDDPIPILNGPMEKINAKIGAVQDPYGLKDPMSFNQRASYYPGLLRQYVEMSNMPASPTAKESIGMQPLGTTGSYDDEYPSPPTAWNDPLGPANLDYGGPKRPTSQSSYYDGDTSRGSFDTTQQDARSGSYMYYDEPPSTDTSVDMRTRPGYSRTSGIQNTSYQPDDSYRPPRML